MNTVQTLAPANAPHPGKCEKCDKEVAIRKPELMMGPNGFRTYYACKDCIDEYEAIKHGGSKPIFATHKNIN